MNLLAVGHNCGHPDQIIHDLSPAIRKACQRAYKDVVQLVCHSHFTKDVGRELYDTPYDMLLKQLKKSKLKAHLKAQRRNKSKWLRNRVDDKDNLILEKVLKKCDVPRVDPKIYDRELFLALNHWMLDYAHDGNRQGYPFDRYLLYFHRRSIIVHQAVNKILASSNGGADRPQCLIYLANKLENYLSDSQVIEAADLFEKAFIIFNDIRDCLRMSQVTNHSSPIYESYEISRLEQQEILNDIPALKRKFTNQMKSVADNNDKEIKLYEIALQHIEKYEPYFINESNMVASNGEIIRTTNKLEQGWGIAKRTKIQVTGKKKLTRKI